MSKVICPYCSEPAVYTDSKEVYKRSYGMFYLCRPCGAYVGCHKGTKVPLGTLANLVTRKWRKEAHKWFDPLWRDDKSVKRWIAYKWLSEYLGIKQSECHIGEFDDEMCKKVVEICRSTPKIVYEAKSP